MNTDIAETLRELFVRVIYSPQFGVVLILIVLLYIRQILNIIVGGLINKSIALASKNRPRILNPGNSKRILLVGDSTAYGAGADRVEDTLAGRFAHDFPQVEVVNYGVNGSLTENVMEQLKRADGQKFNLVLISTGGNDVWHFTNLRKVRRDLHEAIEYAQGISNGKTILLVYNYVALAPAFPFILRGFIMRRGEIMDGIFLDAAEKFGIEAVEVFARSRQPLSTQNMNKYFAVDGVHPSSEGYRVWYMRLWSVLYLHNYGLHD